MIIRVDGYREIGLGHIYRTLTLAHNIFDHEVIFLMDKQYDLGIKLIEKQNFKIEFLSKILYLKLEISPDIIINDILDTSTDYMLKLKNMGIKVFNFEDLGLGQSMLMGYLMPCILVMFQLSTFIQGKLLLCETRFY